MLLTAPALFDHLQHWITSNVLRVIDIALARFICHHANETDPLVLLIIAITSERNRHGHVCLDVANLLDAPAQLLLDAGSADGIETLQQQPAFRLLQSTTLPELLPRLIRSAAIMNYLADTEPAGDPMAPLVLAGTSHRPLLYLRRYWEYEQRIRRGIESRLQPRPTIAPETLRQLFTTLFPATPTNNTTIADEWQRIACALALRHSFALITGGPGTGKTTTVVRLLALLQSIARAQGQPPLRIQLAAPTGKAAARLTNAITLQLNTLPIDTAIRATIPTTVTTLHRLLGANPEREQLRYHANHLLAADVVVVDESSMMDIELFAHLLAALHPQARLILLGDKDQLASVEAGAILGDLCQRAEHAHYTSATADWLMQVTGTAIPRNYIDSAGQSLDQAIVMLRTSYRFTPDRGIGALAALINQRTPPPTLAALQHCFIHTAAGQLTYIHVAQPNDAALQQLVVAGYRPYLELIQPPRAAFNQSDTLNTWARQVLTALGQFQLLTPLRHGAWGVEGLNRIIIAALQRAQLLPAFNHTAITNTAHWFNGRPVLITRNDYHLGLMNGDIGVALALPPRHAGESAQLRVAFPSGDEAHGIRWLLPSRLQAVETVFAMTVHKAQGSEFAHTALVLPNTPTPILTCELLYTAITRAQQHFTLLLADDAVLTAALAQRIQRVTGLRGAL